MDESRAAVSNLATTVIVEVTLGSCTRRRCNGMQQITKINNNAKGTASGWKGGNSCSVSKNDTWMTDGNKDIIFDMQVEYC